MESTTTRPESPATQIVILAGGLGTRLYPLSLERPKALLPVGNISLIARLLDQLSAGGFNRAVLTLPATSQHLVGGSTAVVPGSKRYDERIGQVQHLHELAMAAAPMGFELSIARLPGPVGGQVPAVRKLLVPEATAVMVIYGDSFLSLDFAALARKHASARTQGAVATVVFHRPADLSTPESNGRTYHGVMSVDPDGRVSRFVEKPRVEEIKDGFSSANAAVFICERSLLDNPDFRDAKNFSYDLFEPAVNQNRALVHGFDIRDGFRYDIGSVSRFFEANVKLLRRELAGRLPGKELRPGVWLGEGVVLNEARFTPPVLLGRGVSLGQDVDIGPDVVVGDGCRIEEGAVVRQTVLMNDCRIGPRARLERCVLGPSVLVGGDMALPPHAVLGAFTSIGRDGWPNWTEILL